jgi:hypothetical protein
MLPVIEELFTQVGQWGHFAGDAGPNQLVIDEVITVCDDVTKRNHLHCIRNLCNRPGTAPSRAGCRGAEAMWAVEKAVCIAYTSEFCIVRTLRNRGDHDKQ